MRIIAVEEHYTTQALRDAHPDHPLVRVPPGRDPRQWVVDGLLDVGELRLASMDAAGIDVQVLSQTVPGPEDLEGELGLRLAMEANDVVAEAITAHPGRFAGFATLPVSDPAAAVTELERSVTQLGFVGAMINGHVNGRYLDDQFFWPIFEAAEALEVPIYLHPTFPPTAVIEALYSGFSPAVTAVLANGGLGWHLDTGIHVVRLILGGVFDRFTRLQLMMGHLGEGLPAMIHRMGVTLGTVAKLDRSIADYFANNIHLTIGGFFDPAAFAAAVTAMGTDRIMFSVDYPYASNETGRIFLDQLEVTTEEREKIAHGNAERLLKLAAR